MSEVYNSGTRGQIQSLPLGAFFLNPALDFGALLPISFEAAVCQHSYLSKKKCPLLYILFRYNIKLKEL